jgi:hypothetical protein
VRIARRYNGPPESANGGYACGLVAGLLGGTAEVTLRRPPPLERELAVALELDGTEVELRDGDAVVAEGRVVDWELDIPEPVSPGKAETASKGYPGFREHAYETCFVCGPARRDGLGIFAGPVDGRPGVVAAPWTPGEEVRAEIAWAALDCPSGWAVDDFQREGVLLGRMAAHVLRLPEAGERHVVMGWRRGEDGRKRYAGSAVFAVGGELLASSRSTWIVAAAAPRGRR